MAEEFYVKPAGFRVQSRSPQFPEWGDVAHRNNKRSFFLREEAEAEMTYWVDYFERQGRTDVEFRVLDP